MKKKVLFSALLLFALLFAACAPEVAPAEEAAPAEEEAAPSEAEVMEEKTKCVLITPNPLGDRSFIDSAARGIEKANAELPIECDIIETNGVAEHETALRSAISEGYPLIVALSLDQEMMATVAGEYPEVSFSMPSTVWVQDILPNLSSYLIEVHEGSFLVGLVAGFMSDTKIVGAVVGGDSPGMNQFTYGFEQGVAEACPDCTTLVSYLNFDFANPTLGLETTLGMYDQGADIVYQVAGRSGEGVLEAAAQRGLYAIGVDSNQDWVQPGSVITSMIKRVDLTVFDAIEKYINGTFEGGYFTVGADEGFAGVSWDEGSTFFEDNGPADMVAKLDDAKALVADYRAKIASGEYTVCDSLVHVETPMPECEPFYDAPAE